MIISIDLGSNTIRIALIEYHNETCIVKKSFERIVGSARGLNENGTINSAAKDRIFNAIKEAKSEFDFINLKHIAVATAAFRIAKNSDEIFKEILNKFNINFIIISGNNEAEFINFGVKNALKRLDIKDNNSLFIDLGGASSEISSSTEFKSFKFGIITFFEAFKSVENMQKNIPNITKNAKEFIKKLNPNMIVLTSGVATTMASLKLNIKYKEYSADMINGYEVNKDDFDSIQKWLLNLDTKSAEEFVGENRQMLVVAGLIILKELLNDTNAKIITIDDGLREGVAVAYFKGVFDNILKKE